MLILYGGSFNPPTIAHYEITKYLLKKYQPISFIFIPVGRYYKKANVASFEDRFNMLQLMANQLDNTVVSDFENSFTTFQGTIATLNHFKCLFPNESIYFVIGADNLMNIDQWIRIEDILREYHFIVLNRNQLPIQDFIKENHLLSQYQDKLIIEDELHVYDVSSTRYREEFCDDVVIKEVNDYIYHHKLYNRGVRNEE